MNKFLSLTALTIFAATSQAAVILNDFSTGPTGTVFGGYHYCQRHGRDVCI